MHQWGKTAEQGPMCRHRSSVLESAIHIITRICTVHQGSSGRIWSVLMLKENLLGLLTVANFVSSILMSRGRRVRVHTLIRETQIELVCTNFKSMHVSFKSCTETQLWNRIQTISIYTSVIIHDASSLCIFAMTSVSIM